MLIEVGDWLKLANLKRIERRIQADPYSKAYTSLLSHFAAIRLFRWGEAVVALHIVYGWMPTIPRLRRVMAWEKQEKKRLVGILNRCRAGTDLTDEEAGIVQSFCNNSMVGASKLLHFIRPDMFPIWDRRVAKAFARRKIANINENQNVANLLRYVAALVWCGEGGF